MGVLGGSFNPPHLGHLGLARHAAAELGLQRVLLIPVFRPPHKPVPPHDPGAEHRLEMCRLLLSEARGGAQGPAAGGARAGARRDAHLEVSRIEIDRGGRSYTVDTLRALHGQLGEVPLTLIVGAEMALTLPSWRRPEEIVRLARIAVAERVTGADGPAGAAGARCADGPARKRIVAALRELGGGGQIVFLGMAPIPISSTLVRARLARGEPVEKLVGSAVARYISRRGFYRSGESGRGERAHGLEVRAS